MLDSINVAASGLNGHQKGLKVISNNVANMNTPGYKGDNNHFGDVFLQESGDAPGRNPTAGGGIDFLPPTINFTSGEIRATGRDLDLALKGPGFFVVRDDQGHQLYTKAGRFQFDSKGTLVTMEGGEQVLTNSGGEVNSLVPVSIDGLLHSAFKPSAAVVFNGNLSSTAGSETTTGPEHTIDDLTLFDSMGAPHNVKVTFAVKRETDPTTSAVKLVPGTWVVTVMEAAKTLGTGEFKFSNGIPDPLAERFDLTLNALDGRTNKINFSLSPKATSFANGDKSDLAKESADGNAHGVVSKTVVDEKGAVVITYTNGLTATGPKLAVAEFTTTDGLSRASGALFEHTGRDTDVRLVEMGGSTALVSGSLELSNTDLTDQFSNMILIQRGFQASSQVLSTASEMIQSLFDIRSRR